MSVLKKTERAQPASCTATSKSAPAARTAGAPERAPKVNGMVAAVLAAAVEAVAAAAEAAVEAAAEAAVVAAAAAREEGARAADGVEVERLRLRRRGSNGADENDDGVDLFRLSCGAVSFEATAATRAAARADVGLVDARRTDLESDRAGSSGRREMVIQCSKRDGK